MKHPSGFLNIYKLSGPTSFDCIRVLKKIYLDEKISAPKLGHLGTLDPLAEGVLPIAIGNARRLIRFFSADKLYNATFLLGTSTDTDDIRGETISTSDASHVTELMVKEALAEFRGEIDQVPPMYSATKVKGEKAYKLARMGEKFQLNARKVNVLEIEFISWNPPSLTLRFRVGPGTYIRSIARDLGEKLGIGGCVSQITRESDGPFTVANSLKLTELEGSGVAGIRERLMPPEIILDSMPRVDLGRVEDSEAFKSGKSVRSIELPAEAKGGYFNVCDTKGFVGVGIKSADGGIKPFRIIRVENN